MLSKLLVTIALVFQIIGLAWSFVVHFQAGTIGDFFVAPNWPIFLGFVVLLIAVAQSYQKPKEPEVKKDIFPPVS